jgi:hypothetical protein
MQQHGQHYSTSTENDQEGRTGQSFQGINSGCEIDDEWAVHNITGIKCAIFNMDFTTLVCTFF